MTMTRRIFMATAAAAAATGAAQPVPAKPVPIFGWVHLNAQYGKMGRAPATQVSIVRYNLSAGPSGAGARAWPDPFKRKGPPFA